MAEIILESADGVQDAVDTHNTADDSHPDIRALIAEGGGGGSTPDATTSVKGKVKLAGDLGGTADLPTVPGLASKADASATTTALASKADATATTSALAAKAADSAVVHNTGAESINGVKTFVASPIVPTATTGLQAINKNYADSLVAGGAPDATTGSKGIVQLAGDLAGTAASPTVPGLSGKANTSHTHVESDVTNLVSDLAGKAAASHTHAGADIASGTVGTSRLGSGSASSSTFLRGDQTWATPAGGGGGLGLVTTAVKTGAFTAASGDMVPVNATSGAVAVTLPAAAAGLLVGVRKSDTGTNAVTIAAAGSDVIGDVSPVASVSLAIAGQGYLLLGRSGGWTAIATSESLAQLDLRYKPIALPDVQVFPTAGTFTWTKPAGAKTVTVGMYGGGSGGGSGPRRASGTALSGGAGGSGGAYATATFQASDLGATESVVVGAGSAGGAAVTANDTNGNPSSSAGPSSFGTTTRMQASGASLSVGGGTTTPGVGGGGPGGTSPGGTGASTAVGLVGTSPVTLAGPGAPGGGSGGGISVTPTQFAGGAAGTVLFTLAAGGTAGTAGGGTGGNGGNGVAGSAAAGTGGGGGGSNITGAGGNGGNGGSYGAGGGGGGAALNGSNSGAGGAGAAGVVVVVSY